MDNVDLIAQLRRDWWHQGRGPQAEAALDLLRERHREDIPDSIHDLGELLGSLEESSHLSVEQRARVVRDLLEESGDPRVRRALLQTLVPGVVSVCRQLRFGDGIVADPSETLATALGLLSELLADWAGQRRDYAGPDLLSALRGRLRRWLLKEKSMLSLVSAFDTLDVRSESASRLEARLASYRGSAEDRLARLTFARVFEGRSLRELARGDNSHPVALQSELRRFALRCLL